MTQYVYGKNVVRQCLKQDKKIYEIVMTKAGADKALQHMIEEKRVPIRMMERKQLDALCKSGSHQGIAAKIDDYRTYDVDAILDAIPEGKLPLLIMLDGLEDPHNLGAILRSADAVGADGILLGKHRSVSLTPTVAKVSTGAIETVKVGMVNNLSQTLEMLKKRGFWIVGADAQDAMSYREAHYDVPLVLVIGSEGFGISPLVRRHCDYAVALPMRGSVTSLNASVACGILLYEIDAQRHSR